MLPLIFIYSYKMGRARRETASGEGNPMVSICLPNLNNRAFLPERITSIRDQSFKDYEVVISDNFSDDGAFEYFQEYERSDSRVRLFQKPRNGMYANWNNCLEAARGEWIYFATSDDSMSADCLQKLVNLGNQVPDCGLVTSASWIIGLAGDDQSQDWNDRLGRLLAGRRVTAGRLDGRRELLAGMLFGTPTVSMTQMIIRRSLFERTGLLPLEYGSSGDFIWQMRAFRLATSAYLPRKVGSWRRHESQATSSNVQGLIDQRARMLMAMWRGNELARGADMEVALGFALAWSQEPLPDGLPLRTRRAARLMKGRQRTKPAVFMAVVVTRIVALLSNA